MDSDRRKSSVPCEEPQTSLGVALPFIGLQVLVVDDEPDATEIVSLLLKSYGAGTLIAYSAHEALALLRCTQPDVLISDIRMPQEDGYSFLRKVRTLQAPGKVLPAIAMTACAREYNRQKALSSGYQMYLPKPIELNCLLLAVARLTGRHLAFNSKDSISLFDPYP